MTARSRPRPNPERTDQSPGRPAEPARPAPSVARAPIDTTGGRPPSSQEYSLAREIIRRAGILEPLQARLERGVGRPASLGIEGFLVAAQLNALAKHHVAHVAQIANVLNALSDLQRANLGIRNWNPTKAYHNVDRAFVRLAKALGEGWEAEVDGTTVMVNSEWVANRIARAAIPPEVIRSSSVAVDGTPLETWGRLHGDVETIDLDTETGLGDQKRDESTRVRRRRRTPKAKVLGVGPDGRNIYTADPDARGGWRSATQSEPARKYCGYELHLVVPTRDLASRHVPEDMSSIQLGPEVAGVVSDFSLTPAGSNRADAIVPAIIAAKKAGQPIDEVIWDRGYSQLLAERTTHPLRQAGIDLTFQPSKWRRLAKPFTKDALVIEGNLFSSSLPESLRGPLPMPPMDATEKERLEFEQPFNARARFRYTLHAGPNELGTTRWMSPVHSGLLRSRANAQSMRRKHRGARPMVPRPEDGKCCPATVSASAEELPFWQRLPAGTTAWRKAMHRREVVEGVNAELKGKFVNMARGFLKVFGLAKLTLLLGFTIAGYNSAYSRSFMAKCERVKAAALAVKPRHRARRRRDSWPDILGPNESPATEDSDPNPPSG